MIKSTTLVCMLMFAATAMAGDGVIRWLAATNWGPTEATLRAEHGWKMDPPRVNIEYSPDGGQTWTHRIARGVPTIPGVTNSYTWSLPYDPTLLSTNGRVRIQALPYQDMQPGYAWPTNEPVWHTPGSTNAVRVTGLYVIEPVAGATITNGVERIIRYVSCGAGLLVNVAVSTNGTHFYAIHVDQPTDVPATNGLVWEPDVPTGSCWVVIQSLTDPTIQDVGGPYTVVN